MSSSVRFWPHGLKIALPLMSAQGFQNQRRFIQRSALGRCPLHNSPIAKVCLGSLADFALRSSQILLGSSRCIGKLFVGISSSPACRLFPGQSRYAISNKISNLTIASTSSFASCRRHPMVIPLAVYPCAPGPHPHR